MKITKQHLKKIIQEIIKLDKDGEEEEFGPPEEIDAIYHDSTRDDNIDGYTPMNKKPLKVKILKQKGHDIESFEVD